MLPSPSKPIADFTVPCWQGYPPLPQGTNTPVPSQTPIPRLLQRRLSPLAKIVFQTLSACVRPDERLPAVFSSTHGEVGRSLELLQDLQANGELSPTAFSLSVHNAIAGLFSMIYVNQLETSVIAPGRDGLASGFVEALGLLQEGHPAVLLVFYDEPVPAFFPTAPYQTRLEQPCALALKLASNGAGLPLRMTRLQAAADDREQPLQIPAFLAFLADPGQTQLQLGPWQWQKP